MTKKQLQAENAEYAKGLNLLKQYCQSDKFRINVNVNANDILLRIAECESAVNIAREEV